MKQIISASRRTDMSAYYLDNLLDLLRQGYAEVRNPFSGEIYRVSLRPEEVHTLVLWSKNFRHFLEKSACFSRYNLYFLFTINDMPDLEPGIPDLTERIDQLREIALRYGAESIAWRFDPVIFRSGGPVSEPETFRDIGERIVQFGVTRAIFSFLDMYGKVRKRNEKLKLNLIDPPVEVKVEYALELAGIAGDLGMSLESCCEDIGNIEGITASSCINGNLLARLAGEPADTAKDKGQREACKCTVSRDIGSYKDMPCPNGCLYCYANPKIEILERKLI